MKKRIKGKGGNVLSNKGKVIAKIENWDLKYIREASAAINKAFPTAEELSENFRKVFSRINSPIIVPLKPYKPHVYYKYGFWHCFMSVNGKRVSSVGDTPPEAYESFLRRL